MKFMIDYSDEKGAGDIDPREYDSKEAAVAEANERLESNDMPWAVQAKVFPVDDDGEPLEDQHGSTLIRRTSPHTPC